MALFIGRIPESVRPRDLEDIFLKYGRINRCDIKRGGYGFIEFDDPRDAEDAIRDAEDPDRRDTFKINGHMLVVEWAKGSGRRSSGSDECFKCGRPGHWARDCPGARRSSGKHRSRSRESRRHSRSPSRSRSRSPRRSSHRSRRYRSKSRSRSHSRPRRYDRVSRPRRDSPRDRSYSRHRSPSRSRSPYPPRDRSASPRSRSRSLERSVSRGRSREASRDHMSPLERSPVKIE